MGTKTVRRPQQAENEKLPEWRRICHYYEDDSVISICGTATCTSPSERHLEPECRDRGHTICVVCGDIRATMYPST